MRYLAEVPVANVLLFLLSEHEVKAHQRRQPMTVEIRIGQSSGEGEGSTFDVDLVVQMGGTHCLKTLKCTKNSSLRSQSTRNSADTPIQKISSISKNKWNSISKKFGWATKRCRSSRCTPSRHSHPHPSPGAARLSPTTGHSGTCTRTCGRAART